MPVDPAAHTVPTPLSHPPDRDLDDAWAELVAQTDHLSKQNLCHKLELKLQNLPNDPVLCYSESPVRDPRGGAQIDYDIHYDWQQTLTPTPPLTRASSTPDPENGGRAHHEPLSNLEQANLEQEIRNLVTISRRLRKTRQRARKQSVAGSHHMIRRSDTRINPKSTFYQLKRRDEKEVAS
ncbi:hypothetical protein LTR99_003892 [Exophiala xenobiotica]|uniref:Uncharacterized protein n=1 Tax=Vermiconidia calcicola TaxID=1690605 RepID=A0AAV9PXP9_9PEZI|nr:hypothetical protein LTR99_003892 [Exophiala xenobiotica]KAK5435359.1 hypothetical protein LTR34_002863 [Exophiala xenobiotica]KAK5444758.1 hypothetical protein LTR18_004462 [Exophiala xenobiotica]KAK5529789.1 hypothetical protein LTR25_009568 [Vermiconidia calcicola]KAK5549006.1 hypothetical protein LTR23_000836 [Chaetothyriales sp. CCFEE 6169]